MKNIILIIIVTLFALPIFAGEPTYETPEGVTVIWSKDGKNWKKIMATAEADLTFGDRKDIRNAKKVAKMRAKAEISKFLKEKINSKETIDNITKTLATNNNRNSSAVRKSIEIQTEKISNSSESLLKGVLVIEEDINKAEKYVKITVGMSRKSMKTADSIKNTVNTDLTKKNKSNVKKMNKDNSKKNDNKRVIKRSKNYDNF